MSRLLAASHARARSTRRALRASLLLAALLTRVFDAVAADGAGTKTAGTSADATTGVAPDLPSMDQIRDRIARADAERAQALLMAAVVVPTRREPDPPTGPLAAATPQPAAVARTAAASGAPLGGNGNGIRWRLAPIAVGGNVALDERWNRADDGSSSRQTLLSANVDLATYVWQPWFVQLRGGAGLLLAQGSNTDAGGERRKDDSTAWTGRLGLLVFPASRFPFELRGDVSDSRTNSDFVGSDYRSRRLTASQSYRPPTGSESYNLTYEQSTLSSTRLPDDTVRSLRGLMTSTRGSHGFELSGSHTLNERDAAADETRVTALAARHNYRPSHALTVDNLATYNEARVRAPALDLATEIRQLSSFATWRPQQGDALYARDHPFYLTGSVRFVDSRTGTADAAAETRSFNGTLGASYDITRQLRASGGVSASEITFADESTTLASETIALTYVPDALLLGRWRYAPSAAVNASGTQGAAEGDRATFGAQFVHGLSRHWTGGGGSVSFNVSQSAGAVHDTLRSDADRTLGHSAGLNWQSGGGSATQSFAGFSASDSRSYGETDSAFQLVNLQFTLRTQLTRTSSWSGSLTAQATRARFNAVASDPLPSGPPVSADDSWRKYYSGTLTYENARAFDVPRLRFTLLASANSQQLERRSEGDVDAPRERIDHLIEARLDYAIGRLDARLTLRTAKVERRRLDVLFFRVNRRFGAY